MFCFVWCVIVVWVLGGSGCEGQIMKEISMKLAVDWSLVWGVEFNTEGSYYGENGTSY